MLNLSNCRLEARVNQVVHVELRFVVDCDAVRVAQLDACKLQFLARNRLAQKFKAVASKFGAFFGTCHVFGKFGQFGVAPRGSVGGKLGKLFVGQVQTCRQNFRKLCHKNNLLQNLFVGDLSTDDNFARENVRRTDTHNGFVA